MSRHNNQRSSLFPPGTSLSQLPTANAGSRSYSLASEQTPHASLHTVQTNMPPHEIALTRSIDLRGESLDIRAGALLLTKITVHQSIIGQSSKYIQRALSGQHTQRHAHLDLPLHTPESVEMYVHWLYTNKLPLPLIHDDDDDSTRTASMLSIARAFELGKALIDPSYQDAVLDVLMDKCASEAERGKIRPFGQVVDCLYSCTKEGSPARRLVVDLYVCHGEGDWLFEADLENFKSVFLRDLAVALFDARDGGAPRNPVHDRCAYHLHGGRDDGCYRLGR